MTDLLHAMRLTRFAIAATLIVAACGGSTASPSAAASADRSAAPTVEASLSAAPSEAAVSEAPSVSELARPSFSLSRLTQNLANLDSYRIATTINGTPSYQATVVMKPPKAEAIILGDGTDTTRVIRIGDKAWLAPGNKQYQEVPISMVDPLVDPFPIRLFERFADGNIGALANDLGLEQKNGISARHYRLDSTTPLVGAFASLPAGAAIDFWVADEGYLVAYALTGASNEGRSIDISNVNDPANVVNPPS